MRRITKPIRKRLLPAKLYLNDLEHIYDILRKNTKRVDIYTSDYKVEDVKQLTELEIEEEHRLVFDCPEIDISIELLPNGIELFSGSDSVNNSGILVKIEEVIKKRRVPFGGFLVSIWPYIITVCLIIISIVIYGSNDYFIWFFLAFAVIIIIAYIFMARFNSNSFSTVKLISKKEESSFWKRNKDQILVAIIAAIISSFLTSIAFLILNQS